MKDQATLPCTTENAIICPMNDHRRINNEQLNERFESEYGEYFASLKLYVLYRYDDFIDNGIISLYYPE